VKHTVFITGAATGLGAVTAEEFADHGWEVFAGGHVRPGAASHGIPITLDVTDSESCAAAARHVAAHTDGLGAVINFAGLLDLGPLMEVSEERLQRIFDVNVIGTHRVNRAMFDLVRAGGGRIVNISSESGRFRAGITTGPYAMSKHALEAYSDALRQELLFVGIPVIVIEPGGFRTAMSQHIPERLSASVPPASPFEPIVAFTRRTSAREEKHARDPTILARTVYHAVTSRRPKPRYLVKGGMQSRIMDLLPRTVADRLVKLAVDSRSHAPSSA
jgi:NAD(P)-dependent dehydrogenase (short-subunit alcohol dehydrogenase family)